MVCLTSKALTGDCGAIEEMRVAYAPPSSGPALPKQCPIVRNPGLAARVITYVPDDKAETIAAAFQRVVQSRSYERITARDALYTHGSAVVSRSLDKLLTKVMATQMEMGTSQFSSCGRKSAVLAFDQLP
jgi:hypothetical protein